MPVEKKTIIANGLLFILSHENAYKRVIHPCRPETKVPAEIFKGTHLILTGHEKKGHHTGVLGT